MNEWFREKLKILIMEKDNKQEISMNCYQYQFAEYFCILQLLLHEISNICTGPILCPSNYISINGQCHRKVSYGFLCNFTQQCAYIGAFCTDGICLCQLGYAFDGSKCIPRSKSKLLECLIVE